MKDLRRTCDDTTGKEKEMNKAELVKAMATSAGLSQVVSLVTLLK